MHSTRFFPGLNAPALPPELSKRSAQGWVADMLERWCAARHGSPARRLSRRLIMCGTVKWPWPAAKSGRHTAMRRVIAAVIAGVAVSTAIGGSAPTARADVQCTGQDEPNPSTPEAYQGQYNLTVAKPLAQGLKTFNAAAASADPKQIGQAAGQLYNEISTAPMMFGTQSPFGCYDPAVLTSLQQATNTFAATLDSISQCSGGPQWEEAHRRARVGLAGQAAGDGVRRRAERVRRSIRWTTGVDVVDGVRVGCLSASARVCTVTTPDIADILRSLSAVATFDFLVRPRRAPSRSSSGRCSAP